MNIIENNEIYCIPSFPCRADFNLSISNVFALLIDRSTFICSQDSTLKISN